MITIDSTFDTLSSAIAQSVDQLDKEISKLQSIGKKSFWEIGRGVEFHIPIQRPANTIVNLNYHLDWKDDHSFKPCYVEICIFERTDQGDKKATEDTVQRVNQACLPLFIARGFQVHYCCR